MTRYHMLISQLYEVDTYIDADSLQEAEIIAQDWGTDFVPGNYVDQWVDVLDIEDSNE